MTVGPDVGPFSTDPALALAKLHALVDQACAGDPLRIMMVTGYVSGLRGDVQLASLADLWTQLGATAAAMLGLPPPPPP